MRRVLTVLGLSILACTGATEDTADEEKDPFENDGDTNDTHDTEGESFEQTDNCEDYLDCVAAVSPDEYDDAADRYGADGSCWDDDADEAEACDEACDDLLNALGDDYPDEEACGGRPDDTGNPDDTGKDTGDTDTDTGGDTDTDTGSGSTGCPLDEGDWGISLDFSLDDCGAEGMVSDLPGTVTCTNDSRGEFEIATTIAGSIPLTLECSSSGRDFTCSGNMSEFGISLILGLSGEANTSGNYASGDFALEIVEYGCRSEGSFEMDL